MTGPPVSNQGFPKMQNPLVDSERMVTPEWQKLFLNLWRRAGGSVPSTTSAVYLIQSPTNQNIIEIIDVATGLQVGVINGASNTYPETTVTENGVNFFDSTTNELEGTVIFIASPGGTVVGQGLGASPGIVGPFPVVGQLVVAGAQVELSRDGAVWWLATVQGGSFRLMAGDRARLTWYGVDPPVVSWWPDD